MKVHILLFLVAIIAMCGANVVPIRNYGVFKSRSFGNDLDTEVQFSAEAEVGGADNSLQSPGRLSFVSSSEAEKLYNAENTGLVNAGAIYGEGDQYGGDNTQNDYAMVPPEEFDNASDVAAQAIASAEVHLGDVSHNGGIVNSEALAQVNSNVQYGDVAQYGAEVQTDALVQTNGEGYSEDSQFNGGAQTDATAPVNEGIQFDNKGQALITVPVNVAHYGEEIPRGRGHFVGQYKGPIYYNTGSLGVLNGGGNQYGTAVPGNPYGAGTQYGRLIAVNGGGSQYSGLLIGNVSAPVNVAPYGEEIPYSGGGYLVGQYKGPIYYNTGSLGALNGGGNQYGTAVPGNPYGAGTQYGGAFQGNAFGQYGGTLYSERPQAVLAAQGSAISEYDGSQYYFTPQYVAASPLIGTYNRTQFSGKHQQQNVLSPGYNNGYSYGYLSSTLPPRYPSWDQYKTNQNMAPIQTNGGIKKSNANAFFPINGGIPYDRVSNADAFSPGGGETQISGTAQADAAVQANEEVHYGIGVQADTQGAQFSGGTPYSGSQYSNGVTQHTINAQADIGSHSVTNNDGIFKPTQITETRFGQRYPHKGYIYQPQRWHRG